MKLGTPTVTQNADGSTVIYDPDTGITTIAYPDGSATTVNANGNQSNYSSAANMVTSVASSSPGAASWLTTLTQALPTLATFVNSQQLAQINVTRAQRGLSPLDTTAYGPQVGIGMTSGSMGTIILLAGAALLIAVLMSGRKAA